jgi:hypothetical protein
VSQAARLRRSTAGLNGVDRAGLSEFLKVARPRNPAVIGVASGPQPDPSAAENVSKTPASRRHRAASASGGRYAFSRKS